jgi:hypothetical protein
MHTWGVQIKGVQILRARSEALGSSRAKDRKYTTAYDKMASYAAGGVKPRGTETR